MSARSVLFTAAAGLSLLTGACTTDPETGERHLSRTAIGGIGGALGGYVLGDIVGGRHDRGEKLAGAGLGGLLGAGVGAYMDRQERELRARTAGTDVAVRRDGDTLLVNLPAGITFATDRSEVEPRFRPTLDRLAETLAQYDETFVDVYGHTDSTGPDAYNQQLSERRAAAVADYLAGRGVQPARIGTRGYGETRPVADNDTDAGRAANRRVEIKLVPIRREDLQG